MSETQLAQFALVVGEPWISKILDGSKSWEMRSRGTEKRGWIGLIRKGSGLIVGLAHLDGVGPPLTPSGMIEAFEKHRIPEHLVKSGVVGKWNTPWMLSSAKKLPVPVVYKHKSGAVTWVKLEPHVRDELSKQLPSVGERVHAAANKKVREARISSLQALTRAEDLSRPRLHSHAAGKWVKSPAIVKEAALYDSELVATLGEIVFEADQRVPDFLPVTAFSDRLLKVLNRGQCLLRLADGSTIKLVLHEDKMRLVDGSWWARIVPRRIIEREIKRLRHSGCRGVLLKTNSSGELLLAPGRHFV